MIQTQLTIAFVTPHFIVGGAESYIIARSNWLISNGYNVVIISDGGDNIKNIPQGINHIVFNIDESCSLMSNIDYNRYLKELSDLLLANSIDLIEAHNVNPAINITQSYKYTGIPFYVNVLSERSVDKDIVFSRLIVKLNRFNLYYTLFKEMNMYIEKKVWIKLNPKIIPIPVNGISDKNIGDKDYILSVSRLSPEKMYVQYLIDGFTQLMYDKKINSKYKLIIVGDGPLFSNVEEQIKTANKHIGFPAIEMKGTIIGEELEKLYRQCTLYVGVGTSLLLGASVGKPCLLPGYSDSSRKLSWGMWGLNKDDINYLAAYPKRGRISRSYYDAIDELLNSQIIRDDAAESSKKMFTNNFDINTISLLWTEEYKRVIDIFADPYKNRKISRSINIFFTINLFRIVRKIYRLIKITK